MASSLKTMLQDVVATPAKASERNLRLAAEMEQRDSVKVGIF